MRKKDQNKREICKIKENKKQEQWSLVKITSGCEMWTNVHSH